MGADPRPTAPAPPPAAALRKHTAPPPSVVVDVAAQEAARRERSREREAEKEARAKEREARRRDKDAARAEKERAKARERERKAREKKERERAKADGGRAAADIEATRQFGVPVAAAFANYARATGGDGSECPAVVAASVAFIMENGLEEEGIFRVSGRLTEVNRHKARFDAGATDFGDDLFDPAVVASLFKLWFRELPEPLFTADLAPRFSALSETDVDKGKELIAMLPVENAAVLQCVCVCAGGAVPR